MMLINGRKMLFSIDLNASVFYVIVGNVKFHVSKLIASFQSATTHEFLKFIYQHSLQDVYQHLDMALRIFFNNASYDSYLREKS